ncbi:hypothetical protein CYMTET_56279 [Cymbomonas tetramitiformis]|uniref:Uncharacterized protein n=1 Tax=Cymbomonas tetramitiformis TaxID=36881 RepID=A0AAE0ENX6_9CHLO|nr:hypothetical protein CYMTET_56279 [Cymbomonas tetramitiformis]
MNPLSAKPLNLRSSDCRVFADKPSLRPFRTRARATNTRAGFGEKFDDFVESCKFDNWAPRSARAWGKGEFNNMSKTKKSGGSNQENGRGIELSEAFLKQLAEENAPAEADSDSLTESLERRFKEIQGEALNAVGGDNPITGEELALICKKKYGYYHDMSIKQVCMNKGGMRRWVSLNVYFGFVGQRNFPYTNEGYIDKLDSVAAMLNAFDQADYTRAFFAEKPIPRRGLPSRPRVDTAVSLRLNKSPTWDNDKVEEFFEFQGVS